jgi:AcrR family transcriptional regulator/predicted transcriptional regulator
MMIATETHKFIVDEQGNRTGVILDIQTYEKMCDAVEELIPEHVVKKATGDVSGINTGDVTGEVQSFLKILKIPISRSDAQSVLKLKSQANFRDRYLKPALDMDLVEMTIPEKPKSRNQKYRLTVKGKELLKKLTSNDGLTSGNIYFQNENVKKIEFDSTNVSNLAENLIPRTVKRKDGLKRIEQIMAESLRLFSDQGYHATTVEDIIGAVGIARRTFYLHFNGKNEILIMIIDYFTYDIKSMLENFMESVFLDNSEIEIKKMMCIGVQNIFEQPELRMFFKLMLGEIIGLQDIFFEKVNMLFDTINNIVSETILTAQKEDIIAKHVDPVLASYFYFGGIKEVLFQKLVAGKKIDLDYAVSSLVDLVIMGPLNVD